MQAAWDTLLPLDDAQRAILDRAQAVFGLRQASSATIPDAAAPVEFFGWQHALQREMQNNDARRCDEHIEALTAQLAQVKDLLARVDGALGVLDDVEAQHALVASRTTSLHETCQRLLAEQSKLEEVAAKIEEPMQVFNALAPLADAFEVELPARLLQPAASHERADQRAIASSRAPIPGSDEFDHALAQLDDCVRYLLAHREFRDSREYLTQFRRVRRIALSGLRDRVVHSLGSTCESVRNLVTAERSMTEGRETQLLYARFRTLARQLQPLLAHFLERSADPDVAALALDCQTCYLRGRQAILCALVPAKLLTLSALPLLAQLRAACSLLVRLCRTEFELYHVFFAPPEPQAEARAEAGTEADARVSTPAARSPRPPALDLEAKGVSIMLEEVCGLLHEHVRPSVIHLSELDQLCELVQLLRWEVVEEQIMPLGKPAAAFLPVVRGIQGDAQERLIYRTHRVIDDEIARFVPTGDDLDYPGKLLALSQPAPATPPASVAAGDGAGDGAGDDAAAAAPAIPATGSDQTADRTAADEGSAAAASAAAGADHSRKPASLYATWFPTLERTLLCLSKVYRCVEPNVFREIAHAAIAACSGTLLEAATIIAAREGVLDGDLFLVQQVLVLREQITPFDIDFTTTEQSLDFTSTTDTLWRLVSSRGRALLSSLSGTAALLDLVRQSLPRIMRSQVDSRKSLERQLKRACESFIAHATGQLVEPLLTFLSKSARFIARDSPVAAVTDASSDGQEHGAGLSLRDQAFAAPERIRELLLDMRTNIQQGIHQLRGKAVLYLTNEATASILMKPVQNNVLEALAHLSDIVRGEVAADEALQRELLALVAQVREAVLSA